jgi:hypothetical protein
MSYEFFNCDDEEPNEKIQITEKMIGGATAAYVAAINETAPCKRCSSRGYHHGFGEHGHDPDWCDVCGGSGFVPAYDEKSAMKIALETALSTVARDIDPQSPPDGEDQLLNEVHARIQNSRPDIPIEHRNVVLMAVADALRPR